jgi:SAM-dependent methyltransferase
MRPGKLKKTLQKIRSIGTFYLPEMNLEQRKTIRLVELDVALGLLPPGGRLLEIGAGAGWQARALADLGYEVSAVDLPSSEYRDEREWPVADYDGKKIPFGDGEFDIVFSSNVLEHIPHHREFQEEIHRVLKPDGWALHILPSSAWRFWASLAFPLRYWKPPPAHGEHAANALTEMFWFSRRRWTRFFRETGWIVVRQVPAGVFYTGSLILNSRLGITRRRKMSRWLGSAGHIFVLRKSREDPD